VRGIREFRATIFFAQMIYDQMAIFCKAWNPSMEEEDVVKTTTTVAQ